MQDESVQNEYVIELIAKSLDEPLSPAEQQVVERATHDSLALAIVADSLREFDALLRRTGMAIPDEGFPGRVLARLELYERRRTRTEWLLTLGLILVGSLLGVLWVVLDFGNIVDGLVQSLATAAVLLPLAYSALLILTRAAGRDVMLIYALLVLVLMLIWARASGASVPARVKN